METPAVRFLLQLRIRTRRGPQHHPHLTNDCKANANRSEARLEDDLTGVLMYKRSCCVSMWNHVNLWSVGTDSESDPCHYFLLMNIHDPHSPSNPIVLCRTWKQRVDAHIHNYRLCSSAASTRCFQRSVLLNQTPVSRSETFKPDAN